MPTVLPTLRYSRIGAAAILLIAACAAAVPAEAQTIRVRADGLLEVADAPPDTVVRYTLDGTEPTRDAGVWLAPVNVPAGYTVKARAFTADHTPVGTPMTWTPPATAATAATATTAAKGPRIASSLVPVTQGRDWRVYDWPKRHAAIVALMKERRPEIVMVGDSITHFWGGEPGGPGIDGRNTAPDVWKRAFAGRTVVNLGYGWDRTENVLWRLRNGEFEGVTPKVVVVMIGTNNVTLNTPDEIAAGVTAIVDEIHQRSRKSQILLLGIFPRGEKPNEHRVTIDAINQRLAKLNGRDGVVTWLDIGAKFLGADGSISKDVMYDFLHPSAKGYEIWVEAMQPTLMRLLSIP